MIKKIDDENSSLRILVEDMLSKLELKIKRLTEVDVVKHKHEIQFLEYLQSNFIRLADYRDQICNLIPYYQKEIASNWDQVIDEKIELEKKKEEVETLKQEVQSIQSEETNLQFKKKKLSQQLQKQESNLLRDQKQFNKKGKQADQLHSRIEILSKLEADPNDTFLNKFFESRNRFQAKRLANILSHRIVESNDLSGQMQIRQEKITETAQEIDFQQTQLKELQKKNIKLRKQIQQIMESIKQNGLEIEKAENKIDEHNSILKELSLSIVDIANETARQHSIYKKSCVAPLTEIEYQNLLEESISPNIINQDIEEFLATELPLLETET